MIGLDNLNDYYDVSLKEARLAKLSGRPGFRFHRLELSDRAGMEALFAQEKPQRVIHLAAQAGVRYSIQNPHAYVDSNLVGFMNILEGCRHHGVEHLVYASSSSVYGANTTMPFSVHHTVDHPLSLYAATKKANELMAHTYSHLYRLPTTGLRFFTVYGPWGRPDMAMFLFTKAILAGQPIDVFNQGRCGAISPTLMTSSKAWFAPVTIWLQSIPTGTGLCRIRGRARPPTAFTTSAIINPPS